MRKIYWICMGRTVTPFYTPGYVLLPFNIALLIKSDVCHECRDEQKSIPRPSDFIVRCSTN